MIPVALRLLLAARWPETALLPHVDQFHAQMLRRFSDGKGFGMSRIVRWNTLGEHFRAPAGAKTDFKPENEQESAILEGWSNGGWDTGLYVFGAAIKTEPASAFRHRSLKGPGVLLESTPRAELPAWADVYPIAAEAMRRFESGAASHTASLNGWTLHARPVAATKQTCVECHTYGPFRTMTSRMRPAEANADQLREPATPVIQTGDILGGVIYMYRR